LKSVSGRGRDQPFLPRKTSANEVVQANRGAAESREAREDQAE
jgi:hypothetical protein